MKPIWYALSLAVLAAGCPPTPTDNIRSVRILSPLPGEVLGTNDDLNGAAEGLAIRAAAVVFIDDGAGGETLAGDEIEVTLKTNQTNAQTSPTVNGQANFDSFLLIADSAQPNVINSLQACITRKDGTSLCSEAVVVQTDIVGPPCNIVVPANNSVLDAQDDADQNLLNGFQISEVAVSTDAGDGTQVLLSVDGAQAGASVVQGSVARFVDVKLETGANTLDASCLDQAGNTGTGSSNVSVNVTLPSISIIDPLPGTTITSNFDPASFTVKTDTLNVEPGQPVTLLVDGLPPLLGPFPTDANGETTFTVQLTEGNHTLQAQTVDVAGTPAQSLVLNIVVDVIDLPPTVALLSPFCLGGNTQFFAGDDIDNDITNGVQTQLLASSSGTNVDLTITPTAGAVFTDSVAVAQGLAQFPSATLQIGSNLVALTPRDTATGLTGAVVNCNITVVDVDFLTFIEPSNNQIVGIDDDVDNDISNGLQLRARVSGTSGIANNTVISLAVNGTTAQTNAMNNGQVLFDGAKAIQISTQGSVTLTASAPNPTTPASITITVDTNPPTQVTNLSCDLISVRDGSAVCTFTAPSDPAPGTGVARYEVRVLENQVIDDVTFANAAIVAAPNFTGGTEVINFAGLRPGPTVHVAVIAIDSANNRSVVSNDAIIKVNGVAGPILFATTVVGSPSVGGIFGASVDAAGDVNGDGISDFIVGAPLANGVGEAYLYYGSAQDPSVTFASPSATFVGTGGFFGNAVAGIGDFNGDGLSDLAFAEPFAGNGTIYIFLGRAGGQALSGTRSALTADLTINNDPAQAGTTFGSPLSAVGDVDGDGRDDLLINTTDALAGPGASYLVYGRAIAGQQILDFPAGIDQEFRGAAVTDHLGFSAAGLGDINNDNFDDFAIGAIQFDDSGNDTGPGYVAVFLGGARPGTPPVGALSLTRDDAFAVLTGLAAGTDFGAAISGVGSIDGDNKASIFVADTGINNSSGEIYVFDDINPGTTNAQNALRISGPTSFLGASGATSAAVAGRLLGDIDKDGLPDMIFTSAAPSSIYLLYGNSSIFATSPLDSSVDAFTVTPSLSSTGGVQVIGDINSDGFIDFAMCNFTENSNDGACEIFF